MTDSTAAKIYEWGSYILIIASTIVFFVSHKSVDLTLLVLVVAVYMRVMMYRTRYKASEAQNEEMAKDLRRLTQMLKEKEKQSH